MSPTRGKACNLVSHVDFRRDAIAVNLFPFRVRSGFQSPPFFFLSYQPIILRIHGGDGDDDDNEEEDESINYPAFSLLCRHYCVSCSFSLFFEFFHVRVWWWWSCFIIHHTTISSRDFFGIIYGTHRHHWCNQCRHHRACLNLTHARGDGHIPVATHIDGRGRQGRGHPLHVLGRCSSRLQPYQ